MRNDRVLYFVHKTSLYYMTILLFNSCEIMTRCWDLEKEKRPTFSQMKLRLKSIGIAMRRGSTVQVRDKNQEHTEEDVYMNNNMGPAEYLVASSDL